MGEGSLTACIQQRATSFIFCDLHCILQEIGSMVRIANEAIALQEWCVLQGGVGGLCDQLAGYWEVCNLKAQTFWESRAIAIYAVSTGQHICDIAYGICTCACMMSMPGL